MENILQNRKLLLKIGLVTGALIVGGIILSMTATAQAHCGNASFYTLYGNKTASGSIMAPGMTAAHRTLPFGTKVRISYNGKTADVVINDRGPFHKNRFLDVNKTVADKLGFTNKGVVNLCMEIL